MSHLVTAKEICAAYGIVARAFDGWLADGCPVEIRRRGNQPSMFDPKAVAEWAMQNGKKPKGWAGDSMRVPAGQDQPQDATRDPAERALGMDGYVARCRRQEAYLAGKFAAVVRSDDSTGGEIAAIARALSCKGDELRRAEMALLDHQKQTGELVSLSLATRTFGQLAAGVQQRMMSLPNELAPVIRDYLRDPDDLGLVRDEIDAAIRRALQALPDKLPEIKK